MFTPSEFTGRRLRVRRVHIHSSEDIAAVVARAAVDPDGTAWSLRHGGGVANRYGYPAQTEYSGILARRRPDGVVEWRHEVGRVPANKVTHVGVARAIGGAPWAGHVWHEAKSRYQGDTLGLGVVSEGPGCGLVHDPIEAATGEGRR